MQPFRLNFYLSILLISGILYTRTTAAEATKNQIFILGDSLSAGYGIETGKSWVNLLSARLRADYNQYTLVNSSISGDTTANGLNRLQSELEQYSPTIVILELGANDGLRGMPLNYIKNNLDKLITQSLEANARVLLLGMQIPPNYGKKYTLRFSGIYADLARQHPIEFLPFLLMDVAGHPELTLPDGLHPNQKAQPLIMQNVWKLLEPMLDKDS